MAIFCDASSMVFSLIQELFSLSKFQIIMKIKDTRARPVEYLE